MCIYIHNYTIYRTCVYVHVYVDIDATIVTELLHMYIYIYIIIDIYTHIHMRSLYLSMYDSSASDPAKVATLLREGEGHLRSPQLLRGRPDARAWGRKRPHKQRDPHSVV